MAGVAIIVLILIVIPGPPSVGVVRVHEDAQHVGLLGHDFSSPVFWFVFGIGLLMAQYTITGFDASAHLSEETKGAARGAALGIIMSVVVSVVFGFILLVAVTFAVPDVTGTLDAGAVRRAVHLADGHERQVGRVHARDRVHRAALLRRGLGDVCLAHAVRVLARRRRPRAPALA